MLTRITVIMLNTYREAVRARLLHGLFAVAMATAVYSVIVGEYAAQSAMRVVSDLGAASISLYSIIVAVVIGATSLHRELELKTIFPILARPITRSEYLIGKFFGAVLTLGVFIVANVAILLLALGFMADRSLLATLAILLVGVAVGVSMAWSWPRGRTFVPIGWAVGLAMVAYYWAKNAPEHRDVVVFSATLALLEVAIVSAVATVFAAFSSPFLTAILTLGLFIVGRSADTLAHLPERVFGSAIKEIGQTLSVVFPNLMLYVPPRPLLTGEAAGISLAHYMAQASGHALAWCVALLALAALIFRRRDFI